VISPYLGLAYPGLYASQPGILQLTIPPGMVDTPSPCVDLQVVGALWTPPTTWAVGPLPTCMTGAFCGTPMRAGTYQVTVTATDALGRTMTRLYTYTVQPKVGP
jgi:hypothetical protein